MTAHIKKKHTRISEQEASHNANINKRSIQFAEDELNGAKMLLARWMAIWNIPTNKLTPDQRQPFIDFLQHAHNLANKKVGINIGDLVFGKTAVSEAYPAWKEKIIRECDQKLQNPNLLVAASSDPWSARHSPHCFLDFNVRFIDPNAKTAAECFTYKCFGMKTLKKGQKNDHTAENIGKS